MVKILVCAGARGWSTERVIRGVIANSKYKDDIEITFYWIGGYEPSDWDLIYIHSGAVMNGKAKQYIVDHRDETKWVVGIRGPTAYKRNVHRLTPELWDGFSTGCKWYMGETIQYRKDHKLSLEVPGYVCHGGIDRSMFQITPFPEEFKIGWAGAPATGAKRFKHFMELPFEKSIAGRRGKHDWTDLMRGYKYEDMWKFYATCSIYVNTSFREGGPLPPKEAATCGRPCVITRTGDGVEWVPEEYIVDDYREMIPIIERFKNDRELLVKEGKRFHKLSERWDFSVVYKEYDIMFDGVMSG